MTWIDRALGRRLGVPFLGLAAVLLLASYSPGCASVGYVARQGYYQGRLLWGREDVKEVLARPDLDPKARVQLERILDIRGFGEAQLHLKPTENYTTINLEWNEKIYSVSACRELEFTPYTWWFPVVGTVPYKGFFRKEDADRERARIDALGYETVIHRVGGYSTLGWFKDPILPHMLRYPLGDLASLVLHELAHATLFIPGQVDFNESFASFVGDESALRYLEARFGRASPEYQETRAGFDDEERFNQFMHGLYNRLDAIYGSQVPDAEKRKQKEAVWAGAQEAYAAIPFESQDYRGHGLERMNNADLMQFRRYSGAKHRFAALLASVDGDMGRFFAAIEPLGRSDGDPFTALERLTSAQAGVSTPHP